MRPDEAGHLWSLPCWRARVRLSPVPWPPCAHCGAAACSPGAQCLRTSSPFWKSGCLGC